MQLVRIITLPRSRVTLGDGVLRFLALSYGYMSRSSDVHLRKRISECLPLQWLRQRVGQHMFGGNVHRTQSTSRDLCVQKNVAEIDILPPLRGSCVLRDAYCRHIVDIHPRCSIGKHPHISKQSTYPKSLLCGGCCCNVLGFTCGEGMNSLFG